MIITRGELERRVELILKDFEQPERLVHSFYESLDESWDDDQKLEAEAFDKVLVKGPAVFRRTYEGWEGQRIENPTVADLLRQMQTSMVETKDFHHVFLEGYSVKGKGTVTPCGHCGRGEGEPEVTFIDIHTGS
jgi:hypothetical protein